MRIKNLPLLGATQNKKFKVKSAGLKSVTKKIAPFFQTTRIQLMRHNDYDTLNYNIYIDDAPSIPDRKPINVPSARPPGFTYYPKKGTSQAPTVYTETIRTAMTPATKTSRNRKKFAYLVLPNSQEIIIPFPQRSQFWPNSPKTTAASQVNSKVDPLHIHKDAHPTPRGQKPKGENSFATAGGAANAAKNTQQSNREQQVVQSEEAPFTAAPPPSSPISVQRTNDAEGEKIITNLVSTELTQLTAAATKTRTPAAPTLLTGDNPDTLGGDFKVVKGPAMTAVINERADFSTATYDIENFKVKDAVTQGYVFNDEAFTGTINLASSATRKAAVTSRDGDMFKAIGSLFNKFVPGG